MKYLLIISVFSIEKKKQTACRDYPLPSVSLCPPHPHSQHCLCAALGAGDTRSQKLVALRSIWDTPLWGWVAPPLKLALRDRGECFFHLPSLDGLCNPEASLEQIVIVLLHQKSRGNSQNEWFQVVPVLNRIPFLTWP